MGKGNGSLQNRIFGDKKLDNPKHVFALVISTLKYKDYVMKIIKASKIKESPGIKRLKLSDNMLSLLVYDLVFSKGRIQSGKHPIKDEILKHKTRLHSEFIKLKLKYKVTSIEDLPNVKGLDDETPVRWFRINTIKTSKDQFFSSHEFFRKLQPSQGFKLIKEGMIYEDDYIPNLYGVHPREKIMDTQAYKSGEIIIQDRASCFPATIMFLNFQPKEVIDGCAAPGNKTTHIASYLKDEGLVYAFERDSRRVETLKKMCLTATGKKDLIHITHEDFTKTKPEDFPNVEGLVMDPSCSGSGIFGRAIEDEQEKEEVDTERLERLGRFQFSIMKHALSFPNAKKVVYSTCSIHAEENERVVVDLLMDKEIGQKWQLAPREIVIPGWERRGWAEEFTALAGEKSVEELAGGCVRSVPKEDGGIGFFAACFILASEAGKYSGSSEAASSAARYQSEDSSAAGNPEHQSEDSSAATHCKAGHQEESESESETEEWTGFD